MSIASLAVVAVAVAVAVAAAVAVAVAVAVARSCRLMISIIIVVVYRMLVHQLPVVSRHEVQVELFKCSLQFLQYLINFIRVAAKLGNQNGKNGHLQ